MGWAYGRNNNGREIGYGVEATCDLEGCDAKIDRGQAYICGGLDGVGNAGMDDEPYCGDFFCAKHLYAVPDARDPNETLQVCVNCKDKAPGWPENATGADLSSTAAEPRPEPEAEAPQ